MSDAIMVRGLRRLSITATTRREPGDLAAVEGVHNADIDGTTLRCSVDRERLPEVMDRLGSLGVVDIVAQPPTLEDLFLEHYRDDVSVHRTTAGGVR